MDKIEQRRPLFEQWAIETIGKETDAENPQWVCERNQAGDYASVRINGNWSGWNAALDKASENNYCPFCGCDDFQPSSNGEGNHFISCLGCGVEGPVADTVDEAYAAWNRRPGIG